jgi:hypothetical protein
MTLEDPIRNSGEVRMPFDVGTVGTSTLEHWEALGTRRLTGGDRLTKLCLPHLKLALAD